jgi:hypothetical protein
MGAAEGGDSDRTAEHGQRQCEGNHGHLHERAPNSTPANLGRALHRRV